MRDGNQTRKGLTHAVCPHCGNQMIARQDYRPNGRIALLRQCGEKDNCIVMNWPRRLVKRP